MQVLGKPAICTYMYRFMIEICTCVGSCLIAVKISKRIWSRPLQKEHPRNQFSPGNIFVLLNVLFSCISHAPQRACFCRAFLVLLSVVFSCISGSISCSSASFFPCISRAPQGVFFFFFSSFSCSFPWSLLPVPGQSQQMHIVYVPRYTAFFQIFGN